MPSWRRPAEGHARQLADANPTNEVHRMRHFDNVLRVYADQGLRSVEEWKSLGREIAEGTTARTEAQAGGRMVPLYTRDQTRPSAPSQRRKSPAGMSMAVAAAGGPPSRRR
jgi:hypothetical protein